jgi:hypothetical protein
LVQIHQFVLDHSAQEQFVEVVAVTVTVPRARGPDYTDRPALFVSQASRTGL